MIRFIKKLIGVLYQKYHELDEHEEDDVLGVHGDDLHDR